MRDFSGRQTYKDQLLMHVYANFCMTDSACREFGSVAIYRAVAGMLNSIDKKISERVLEDFLREHEGRFAAWRVYSEQYSVVYDILDDDLSREQYVAAIAARMFWDLKKYPYDHCFQLTNY